MKELAIKYTNFNLTKELIMSTRATYRIKELTSEGKSIIRYFYIHYDGYPEGAASYFEALLKHTTIVSEKQPYASLNIDSFILRPGKAITAFGLLAFAEFTQDHLEHGDTEYQYNLDFWHRQNEWFVQAVKVDRWGDDRVMCKEFYNGSLKDYIELFSKKAVT